MLKEVSPIPSMGGFPPHFEGGGPAIRSKRYFNKNRIPLIMNEIPPNL